MEQNASLRVRAFRGLAFFMVAIAATLFVPAWTPLWWQAWLFLAVFTAAVLAITLYFLKADPALVERRLTVGPVAEKEHRRQFIQTLANVAFVAVFVVAGFGRQYGWSHLPIVASAAGDALVILGLTIVFLVFREDSRAAVTAWVDQGQPVVATGPYRYVRHPLYTGALIMMLGIPLALGSAVAFAPFAALVGLIVARLIDEERMLTASLPGYAAYCAATPSRLIPHIW